MRDVGNSMRTFGGKMFASMKIFITNLVTVVVPKLKR
jgi:hypothetical protein